MLRDLIQGSVERSSDQRGAERHVLRLAAVIDAPCERTVTVHNLSRTGLLVASDAPLTKGEEIVVEFAGGARHCAEVVWADDQLFGCRFAEPLSRAALSAALLRAPPVASNDRSAELSPRWSPPEGRAPGALTGRAKASIIGSAALLCWAGLASAVFIIVD